MTLLVGGAVPAQAADGDYHMRNCDIIGGASRDFKLCSDLLEDSNGYGVGIIRGRATYCYTYCNDADRLQIDHIKLWGREPGTQNYVVYESSYDDTDPIFDIWNTMDNDVKATPWQEPRCYTWSDTLYHTEVRFKVRWEDDGTWSSWHVTDSGEWSDC